MRDAEVIQFRRYNWKGIDQSGGERRGSVAAEDLRDAEEKVQAQGIEILRIKAESSLLSNSNKKKIETMDVVMFIRQMATMLVSGIPLVQALEIVASGLENINMLSIVMTIHKDVSAGSPFSDALQKYPKQFDFLTCSLIKVGEQSGTLDVILVQISDYLERMQLLKSRFKKALFYPAIMLAVTIAVAVVLLVFVVPQFQSLFAGFGAELPKPTLVVIAFSDALQAYWAHAFAVIIFAALLINYLKKHSERFRYFLANASLKVIIFGELNRKSAIARITRTLSITLAAGIPLVDALECVADVAGNLIYRDAILSVRDEVIEGNQMYAALSRTELFPTMALQMIGVGEQVGALEAMLTKVSDFFDEEVDAAVEGMSTLVEPIMLVLLGIVVGGFVVSMYLPIFEIGTLV